MGLGVGKVTDIFLALSFYAWIQTRSLIFLNHGFTANMILMLEETSEKTRSSAYMLEYDILLLSLVGRLMVQFIYSRYLTTIYDAIGSQNESKMEVSAPKN